MTKIQKRKMRKSEVRKVRRKIIIVLLLVALPLVLTGCFKKKHYVAPPPEPGVPTNLVATIVSSTQINLIWTDNSIDEKGFYVYRRNGGSYRRIVALDPNATSYNDTGLNPETTYWYKVTCYGDGGESNSSNEASAVTMKEVEILDYHIEKTYDKNNQSWDTCAIGNVKNNTNQILTVKIGSEFYSYDNKWIALHYGEVWGLNPSRVKQFKIYHSGKTEIKYVKVWVDEYY